MRGRTRQRALAAGAAAIAVAATAVAQIGPPVIVDGPTSLTPGCIRLPQLLKDKAIPNSEQDARLAADPSTPGRLVALWSQDAGPQGPRAFAAARSTDGGATWTTSPGPVFSRCAGGNRRRSGNVYWVSEPSVSIGPDGTVYATGLGFGVGPSPIESDDPADYAGESEEHIFAATSSDGGATWRPTSTLATVDGSAVGVSDSSVAADPARPGVAYAVWNDRSIDGVANTIYLRRTLDGGATWERRRVIRAWATDSWNHQIIPLPGGVLLDVFSTYSADETGRFPPGLQVIRSTDGGLTWGAPRRIASTRRRDSVFGPWTFSMDRAHGAAVNRSDGTVYVVWSSTVGRITRALIARSADGGRTWSRPQRIGADPALETAAPSVEVAADGSVVVAYLQLVVRRQVDLWVARSTDGGRTFAQRDKVTTATFDVLRSGSTNSAALAGDGPAVRMLFTLPSATPGNPTSVLAATVP